MTASSALETLLRLGETSQAGIATVKTTSDSPIVAVGVLPGPDLKLLFVMPPGTLLAEVKTARLSGKINQTVNGIFSNGSVEAIQTDCLMFDELTPAVMVVLDAIEAAILTGDHKSSGELTADFVELFSPGEFLSEDEITGLWGELVVISSFRDPGISIKNWHESLDSRYDFAVEDHRLEVKTTLGTQRKHTFSSTQLPPQNGTTVTVASVLAEQTASGDTIVDLWREIRSRTLEPQAVRKLDKLVLRLVKKDPAKAESFAFDYKQSVESICFFDSSLVPQVSLVPGVVSAKWTSLMDGLEPISRINLPMGKLSELFGNR